jgi:hypothetical protein
MKVTIHQPQYLPWLPYLLKIEESDVFVILDTVDFQKSGLQNRNQIKTAQGAHWLTVPVKQKLGQKICDVNIDNRNDWRRKHWHTIRQCYGKATAFKTYEEELDALYSREWQSLNELNIEFTAAMMRWMNVKTPIIKSSQMAAVGSASDLVLNLCLELGAKSYLSGAGGKSYLDEDAFNRAGVEITYRSAVLPDGYPQLFPKAGFINHLTALDMLLNCGESWRNHMPLEVITK